LPAFDAGPFPASMIASDASIQAALEPVKLFEGICEGGATSAADLLSKPSGWMSRAPVTVFGSERLRLRAVWAWLWGLFRPAASLPATASGWKSFFSVSGIERPAVMPTNVTVTGPVTGGRRGWPFSLPLTDLASVGYVAEEFFLDGAAAAYEAQPGADLTLDGNWRFRQSRTAPFRTRVLVVRPLDMARFNGVVHVNWQNVTAGFELGTADFESDQLLEGFAWVGVSAQRVGVHGLPGGEQFALRGWDPEKVRHAEPSR
jgi:Alpha/beta hydrolase domain